MKQLELGYDTLVGEGKSGLEVTPSYAKGDFSPKPGQTISTATAVIPPTRDSWGGTLVLESRYLSHRELAEMAARGERSLLRNPELVAKLVAALESHDEFRIGIIMSAIYCRIGETIYVDSREAVYAQGEESWQNSCFGFTVDVFNLTTIMNGVLS